MTTQRWLRACEVAEMLDVTGQTVWRWRKDGRGPAYHWLGPHTLRYRAEDIEEFIAKTKQAGK
jgi:predicted DNA-binding transcriptional regulator AlpA